MPGKYQYHTALRDPDHVQEVVQAYFEECEADQKQHARELKNGELRAYGKRPTVPALALALGCSSKTVERYAAEGVEIERRYFDLLDKRRDAMLLSAAENPAQLPTPDDPSGGRGGDYRGGDGGAIALAPSDSFLSLDDLDDFPAGLDEHQKKQLDAHRQVCLTLAYAYLALEDVYLQQGLAGMIDGRLTSLVLSRWGYGERKEIDTTVRVVVEGLTPAQLQSLGR